MDHRVLGEALFERLLKNLGIWKIFDQFWNNIIINSQNKFYKTLEIPEFNWFFFQNLQILLDFVVACDGRLGDVHLQVSDRLLDGIGGVLLKNILFGSSFQKATVVLFKIEMAYV